MAPLVSEIVRVPSLKLKIVFAPKRAIVRSVKVSSARESAPVRTAVSPRTSSLTAAGRGAAWPGRSFTSLITWVTRASFSTPPAAGETAKKIPIANAAQLNRLLHLVHAADGRDAALRRPSVKD